MDLNFGGAQALSQPFLHTGFCWIGAPPRLREHYLVGSEDSWPAGATRVVTAQWKLESDPRRRPPHSPTAFPDRAGVFPWQSGQRRPTRNISRSFQITFFKLPVYCLPTKSWSQPPRIVSGRHAGGGPRVPRAPGGSWTETHLKIGSPSDGLVRLSEPGRRRFSPRGQLAFRARLRHGLS